MFFLEEIDVEALVLIWSSSGTSSEFFKVFHFVPKEYSYTGFL